MVILTPFLVTEYVDPVPVTVDAPKTAPISGGSDSGPNRPEPAPKPAEPLRKYCVFM